MSYTFDLRSHTKCHVRKAAVLFTPTVPQVILGAVFNTPSFHFHTHTYCLISHFISLILPLYSLHSSSGTMVKITASILELTDVQWRINTIAFTLFMFKSCHVFCILYSNAYVSEISHILAVGTHQLTVYYQLIYFIIVDDNNEIQYKNTIRVHSMKSWKLHFMLCVML